MIQMPDRDFGTSTLFGLSEILEALLRAQYVTDYVLEPCNRALRCCEIQPESPKNMKEKITEWHQALTTISSTLGGLALDLGEKMSRSMVATVAPPPKRSYKPETGICYEVYTGQYELKDLRTDGTTLANALCWLITVRNEAEGEIQLWESQHWCPFADDINFVAIDRIWLHISDTNGIEDLAKSLELHLERLSGLLS